MATIDDEKALRQSTLRTTSSRLASAAPPGSDARWAFSFHSAARRLISRPFSPTIASRIITATSARFTSPPISIPTVGLLLPGERPAQHRHNGRDALARGVPAGVRQAHPHRLVPEDLRLRAPRGEHGAAVNRCQELRRHHGRLSPDEVRPDVPYERVAAVGQPPPELQELLGRHHGDASVVDVHDGSGAVPVEPREEAVLLLPEVGAEAVERGAGGDDVAGVEMQRTDGVHGREDGAHGVENRLLECVEGVEQDGVWERQPLGLAHDVVE
uniref:Uncharacterized protein n=1 Tax=Aegilops tauschii TaxID=37682 RepID=R7WA92_AEGTA